jgi:hypothetical protein
MLKWALASIGSVVLTSVLSFGMVINHFSTQKPPTDILGAYNETRYQLSSTVSGKLTNEVHDLIDKASKPLVEDLPAPDPSKDQLEEQVVLLQQRLAAQERAMAEIQLNARGSAPSSNNAKPSTVFIPIGIGGSSTGTDWTVINTQEIEIDTSEIPGYLAAFLTVELKVKDGNGKAFARLFNVTDNTPIYSSEVSVSNSDFTPITSGSFTLATGKKKYRLQLKSLTGYQVDVQLSKLKISF